MKSFKKSLKSMNFILLGPWAEKKSGRESSGRALGELWEAFSSRNVSPIGLGQHWESFGRALGELWETFSSRSVSPKGEGQLWESSP